MKSNFLDGLTINNMPLSDYLKDKSGSDALDSAREEISLLGKISYKKPVITTHRYYLPNCEPPSPVRHVSKEAFMEEKYQELYDKFLPSCETWIGTYLSNNDSPNQGVLITAVMQMGWITCQGIVETIHQTVKKHALDVPSLKQLSVSGVSSRISTMMRKPAKGSYLYAFIETREQPGLEGKRKAAQYRLWPPLIQISPTDLFCLNKNPYYGKGVDYSLTDLKAKVPDVAEYLHKRLPAADGRTTKIIKRIMPEPSVKPGLPVATEQPVPDEQQADIAESDPEAFAFEIEADEQQEDIAESEIAEQAKPSETPPEAPQAEQQQFYNSLVEYLVKVLPTQQQVAVDQPTTLDINVNVNFSFGKPR